MTPHEFRQHQRQLDASDSDLCRLLGIVNTNNIQKWKRGVKEVPAYAAKLIALLVALDGPHCSIDELRRIAGLEMEDET